MKKFLAFILCFISIACLGQTKNGTSTGHTTVVDGAQSYIGWTTGGRPGSPLASTLGYNSDSTMLEYYTSIWNQIWNSTTIKAYVAANASIPINLGSGIREYTTNGGPGFRSARGKGYIVLDTATAGEIGIYGDTSAGKYATQTMLTNGVTLPNHFIGIGNSSNKMVGGSDLQYNTFGGSGAYLRIGVTGAGVNVDASNSNYGIPYSGQMSGTNNTVMGSQINAGGNAGQQGNTVMGSGATANLSNLSSFNTVYGAAALPNGDSNNIALGRFAGDSSAFHKNDIFVGNFNGSLHGPLTGGSGLRNTYIFADSVRTDSNNTTFVGRQNQRIILGNGGGNTALMNTLKMYGAIFFNTDSNAYCFYNGTAWIAWQLPSNLVLTKYQIPYGNNSNRYISSTDIQYNFDNSAFNLGPNTYTGGFATNYWSVIGGTNTFYDNNSTGVMLGKSNAVGATCCGLTTAFNNIIVGASNTMGNPGSSVTTQFIENTLIGQSNTLTTVSSTGSPQDNTLIGLQNQMLKGGNFNLLIGRLNDLRRKTGFGFTPQDYTLVGSNLVGTAYQQQSIFGQYNDTTNTSLLLVLGGGTGSVRQNAFGMDSLKNYYFLTSGNTSRRPAAGYLANGIIRINTDSAGTGHTPWEVYDAGSASWHTLMYNGYQGGAGSYTLPPATSSVLGGVIPDGTQITVDGSGHIILGFLLGGNKSYTPTLTNTTNISSSALTRASWSRDGDLVNMVITGVFTATSPNTGTTLTFTLPLATTNGSQSGIGAVSLAYNAGGLGYGSGYSAVTSTTQGQLYFNPTSVTNDNFTATLQYAIQ